MTARRLKKDKRWMLIKLCFFVYVFIGVFALVWLRTEVVNLEYELGQLESRRIKLIKQAGHFSAERASLYSVSKIEEIAAKRFGMSFPDRKRVFFVKTTTGAVPYRVSVKSVPESRYGTSSAVRSYRLRKRTDTFLRDSSNPTSFKKNKWDTGRR